MKKSPPFAWGDFIAGAKISCDTGRCWRQGAVMRWMDRWIDGKESVETWTREASRSGRGGGWNIYSLGLCVVGSDAVNDRYDRLSVAWFLEATATVGEY